MPHTLFRVTVVDNATIADNLRRLTLHAPEFASHSLTGPDEFFGLIMPAIGERFLPPTLEDDNIRNIRAAVNAIDEDKRPALRWYTIREHLPEKSCITVDIVTHGDNGPGSAWVLRAQPGQEAGYYPGDTRWTPQLTPEQHSPQLLIADCSSAPALRSILEHKARHAPEDLELSDVILVAEAAHTEDLISAHSLPTTFEPGFAEEWEARLRSLNVTYQAKIEDTLKEIYSDAGTELSHPTSMWVCGEGELAKQARRYAINSLGVDAEHIVWIPFWLFGRPRP